MTTLELVIDPTISYGSLIEGAYGTAAAVLTSSGHEFVFVAGSAGIGLPVRNSFQPVPSGAFVCKFDVSQAGDASLVYSTYLGGSGVAATGLAADPTGDVIVVGSAAGSLPLVGPFMSSFGSQYPAEATGFVARLSAAGNNLVYSTYFPGSPRAVALDQTGRVNLVGYAGPGFPTTAGAFMATAPSGQNAFVSIVDTLQAGASSFVYGSYLGGSYDDVATGVAIDLSGNVYVAGTTTSVDFPLLYGAQMAAGGNGDVFIVKLNLSQPGPSSLLYGTYLGGSARDSATGIAVGTSGRAYVTGVTGGPFPVTAGALQTVRTAGASGFAACVDTTASGAASLIYATYLSGPDGNDTQPVAIGVDTSGDATIIGSTDSPVFPVTAGGAFRGTGLFQSVDGGQTWHGLQNGANFISQLDIDSREVPPTLYGISADGVVTSVNGGVSWTVATQGLPSNALSSLWGIAIDPGATATAFTATDQGVFRTTDGGSTWQVTSLTVPAWPIVAHEHPAGSAIYAFTQNGLFRTRDHGNSWQQLGDVPWGRQIDFDDTTTPPTLYVNAAGAGILKSTDDGMTWSDITPVGFGRPYAGLALDHTSAPPTVYALIENWPGPLLLESSDGGNSWLEFDQWDVNYVGGGFPYECNSPLYSCPSSILVADESTQPATLYWSLMDNVWKSTDRGLTRSALFGNGAFGQNPNALPWELRVDRGTESPRVLYMVNIPAGNHDVFITTLNPLGTALLSSMVVGGTGNDLVGAGGFDQNGGAFVTGTTSSPNLPTPSGFARGLTGRVPGNGGLSGGFLLATGPSITAPPSGCASNCSVALEFAVPAGTVEISLPNVTGAGTTSVAPVADQTLATLALSDNLGSWDVSTTASYSASVGSPITLCFTVLSVNDPTVFSNVRIWHIVNGVPTDATISHDFTTRQVCASVTSLSPFVAMLGPRAPTLAWTAPASIVYGTALGGAQLDATASVPGTFVYTPSAGAVLPAGNQALSVTFTPFDLIKYSPRTTTVPLTVAKATPALTWPVPAPLTLGTPLSSSQLNATANVPGASTYAPAMGTVLSVGLHTLTANFTPGDVRDYTLAAASVPLGVTYNICLLYDPTNAVKSGATVPIKLTLCDVNGLDRSSSSIMLKAAGVTLMSTNASGTLIDSGNSNPDNDFRFDPTLVANGGYIFNLKTTGLGTGTYALAFSVTGDPVLHRVQFEVK